MLVRTLKEWGFPRLKFKLFSAVLLSVLVYREYTERSDKNSTVLAKLRDKVKNPVIK
jgi:hypothetical protein